MKAKYLKGISAVAFACTLFLSSCLKDSRYVDFAASGYLIEIPKGGLSNFGADALTESTDTIVRQMAVNLASPNPLKTDLVVTIANSASVLAAYNAANPAIAYLPFPTGSYIIGKTTVTIPAGQRTVIFPVTIYKSMLDPSKSYMLPVTITGTNNPSVVINALYPTHYYHFIGNDFAGTYVQNFQRYNASDSTSAALNGASFTNGSATFSPVSPTEFTVYTGYDGGNALEYDVTFTKNADATYTNFQLSFVAADVASLSGAGVTIAQQPVFLSLKPNAATTPVGVNYTFAQAEKLFHFQYEAMTTAPRYLIDEYHK